MAKEITYGDVEKILADPSVHDLTKNTIRTGMTKDPVDAYHGVLLAAKALKAVMDHRIKEAV